MHGKKKHCSHKVYSVVEQMLNVNFVLAGNLQVRYKDTLAVKIVLHDMLQCRSQDFISTEAKG